MVRKKINCKSGGEIDAELSDPYFSHICSLILFLLYFDTTAQAVGTGTRNVFKTSIKSVHIEIRIEAVDPLS